VNPAPHLAPVATITDELAPRACSAPSGVGEADDQGWFARHTEAALSIAATILAALMLAALMLAALMAAQMAAQMLAALVAALMVAALMVAALMAAQSPSSEGGKSVVRWENSLHRVLIGENSLPC